jgi:3-hydroxyacyl-CoA dehydrogenase
MKLVSKGKMSQENADKAMGTIHFTTDMKDLQGTDFIVEAGMCNDQFSSDTSGKVASSKSLLDTNLTTRLLQSLKTWI